MRLRQGLIAIAAVLIIGAAFYFLAWSPLNEQETALEAETAQLQTRAQQLRNQLAQLQQIRDSELEIRADLNRLRALIPSDDPAQPSFVRAAQLAADASGVAIQSLVFELPVIVEGGPQADAQGRVLAQIPFNSVFEGGYFQAVDLFRRLEVEVVRAVQVDAVAITEGSDGYPSLGVTVTGRIFTLMPVTQVEVAPEAPAEGGEGAEGTIDGATDAPADGEGDPADGGVQ